MQMYLNFHAMDRPQHIATVGTKNSDILLFRDALWKYCYW